jgi:hypothetical protein
MACALDSTRTTDPENQFNYPQIDPELVERIESMDPKTLMEPSAVAYNHELLWFGVDIVAITHLMRVAQSVCDGKLPLEEFLSRYGFVFSGNTLERCTADRGSIVRDGLYLKAHQYKDRINFLNPEHLQKITSTSMIRTGSKEKLNLCRRIWHPKDFADPKKVKLALEVAKDLWTSINISFEQYSRYGNYGVPQNSDLTEIGRQLIKYYWQIINAGENEDNKPRPWTVYKISSPCYGRDKGKRGNATEVYCGNKRGLMDGIKQRDGRLVRTIEVINKQTRQEVVQALSGHKIFQD